MVVVRMKAGRPTRTNRIRSRSSAGGSVSIRRPATCAGATTRAANPSPASAMWTRRAPLAQARDRHVPVEIARQQHGLEEEQRGGPDGRRPAEDRQHQPPDERFDAEQEEGRQPDRDRERQGRAQQGARCGQGASGHPSSGVVGGLILSCGTPRSSEKNGSWESAAEEPAEQEVFGARMVVRDERAVAGDLLGLVPGQPRLLCDLVDPRIDGLGR